MIDHLCTLHPLGEPCQQFVAVSRIDDQPQWIGQPVDQDIVEHAALVVADQRVAHLTLLHPRNILGHDLIERGDGIVSDDLETSHVTQVEDSGTLANRMVFSGEARVPDWHLEATELD